MLASFLHEGYVVVFIELGEPRVQVGFNRFEEHAVANAAHPNLRAGEPEFLRKANRLASAVFETVT